MHKESHSELVSPSSLEDRSPVANASWDEEQASTVVVETIADIRDEDPLSMPPLFDGIDPGALDALMEHAAEKEQPSVEVRFTYHGFNVSVLGNGFVCVEPLR